jgi:CelD/BcsL family acetyltransferase involved in cellulose biosynthesis
MQSLVSNRAMRFDYAFGGLILLPVRRLVSETRLRLVLHREIPENADLRDQWNALVLRTEQPQVFYTYEWALAVHRAYAESLRPLLFLAYAEDGTLCGVAALATDPVGHSASFLCATTGDYCDFLSEPQDRDEFVGSVLAELRKLNIGQMALANLPADSMTAEVLRKHSATHGYRSFARTGYVCAQVSLSSLVRRGDAKPVLPRKKMLRRFLNAMGRETPVRLDHARSWDAIEGVLPEFVEAHVARFLVTGRISNAARAERRAFLAELAKLLSIPGWVVLTRMMSGEKVFAWNYGFLFQGTWFWYQPTFVNDLEKYSPGFCLLAKLIEEAADDPNLKTVDLGLGAEEYKDRFANQTRKILYVTLHTSTAQHYVEIVRYQTAERLRELPRVEKVARAIFEHSLRLRHRLRKERLTESLAWAGRRLRELIWLRCEVWFYEWGGTVGTRSNAFSLQTVDLNILAAMASQYADDEATLNYLLRAAVRFQDGKAEGFALVDAEGKFVHCAWAKDFDGFFLSELNASVEAPSRDAVMIFDCWTPAAALGHGYYAHAVDMVAKLVRERGRRPWIFSAAANTASVRGLDKTSFRPAYSLIRLRFCGWQRIQGETPKSKGPANETSAGSEDSAA